MAIGEGKRPGATSGGRSPAGFRWRCNRRRQIRRLPKIDTKVCVHFRPISPPGRDEKHIDEKHIREYHRLTSERRSPYEPLCSRAPPALHQADRKFSVHHRHLAGKGRRFSTRHRTLAERKKKNCPKKAAHEAREREGLLKRGIAREQSNEGNSLEAEVPSRWLTSFHQKSETGGGRACFRRREMRKLKQKSGADCIRCSVPLFWILCRCAVDAFMQRTKH